MGYLKTVLTYSQPSEAEIDKAFLESRGLAVCLLNANTSRNELGAPFFIQLQVMEEEVENARNLIKQANPQRFGSSQRVNEIDRELKRALARFVFLALPAGIVAGLAAYFLAVDPAQPRALYVRSHWVIPDFRVELAILTGLIACLVFAVWDGRRRK